MVADKLKQESQSRSQRSNNLPDASGTDLLDESHNDGDVDNSLALVPVQTRKGVSNFDSSLESKQGWSFLRWIFLPKHRHTEKSRVKKNSVVKSVLKLPSWNSSSVVYPDKKQTVLSITEDHSSNLEGENGAIVPMVGHKVAWSPVSPCHGSNGLPEELKGLHEKYSSSCRLFSYEELCLATSNFLPGLLS